MVFIGLFLLNGVLLCIAVGSYLVSDGELLGVEPTRGPVFEDTYLLPSVYGGHTNQLMSFYIAAHYCILHNIALVLPQLVFDVHDMVEVKLRPFSYFYSIDYQGHELGDRHFKYVDRLPVHLRAACFAQLHAVSTESTHMPATELLDQYFANHGVVCLHPEGTFYGLANAVQNITRTRSFLDHQLLPMTQSLRSMLVLNDMFKSIIQLILERMIEKYGHADYLSVHVRTEPDFVHACLMWSKRTWAFDKPDQYRACYQDDTVIYDLLVSPVIQIPLNNSVIMVMNYATDDLNFDSMLKLCHNRCDGPDAGEKCYVFHCLRKESLISTVELLGLFPELIDTPSSLAMIDSQLALHGILFFGNMYSTMSVEIMYQRMLGRTRYTESLFYNRYCSEYSDDLKNCP